MLFRSSTENESECEAEIIISFAADIKLCHQAYMVYKFNTDSGSENHRRTFTRKIIIADHIIESDTQRRAGKRIYFGSLAKAVFTGCGES